MTAGSTAQQANSSGPADSKLGREVVVFSVGSLPQINSQHGDAKQKSQTTEGFCKMLSSTGGKPQAGTNGWRTASNNKGAMNRTTIEESPVSFFTCTSPSPSSSSMKASTTLLTWESAPALPSLPSILSADRAAAAEQYTQAIAAKRKRGLKRGGQATSPSEKGTLRGRDANGGKLRPGASSITAAPAAAAVAADETLGSSASLPSLPIKQQTPPGREQPSQPQEALTPHWKPSHQPLRYAKQARKRHRAVRLPKLSMDEDGWSPLEQLRKLSEQGFSSRSGKRPENSTFATSAGGKAFSQTSPLAASPGDAKQPMDRRRLVPGDAPVSRAAQPMVSAEAELAEPPVGRRTSPAMPRGSSTAPVGKEPTEAPQRPVTDTHRDQAAAATAAAPATGISQQQQQAAAPAAGISQQQQQAAATAVAPAAATAVAPAALATPAAPTALTAPAAPAAPTAPAAPAPPAAPAAAPAAPEALAAPAAPAAAVALAAVAAAPAAPAAPATLAPAATPAAPATPATPAAAPCESENPADVGSVHAAPSLSPSHERGLQEPASEQVRSDAACAVTDDAGNVDAQSQAGSDDGALSDVSDAQAEGRIAPGSAASADASDYSEEFDSGSEDAESPEEETANSQSELIPKQPKRASQLHFETKDESKERSVFDQLKVDVEILREQLPSALSLMGYRNVNLDWVEELAGQVIDRRSLLDFREFQEFVNLYYERRLDVFSEEYRAVDLDGNNSLSAAELAVHLRRHSITVVPGIVRELLKEIKDDAHTELATIDDYAHLREIIEYRGGFTSRETEAIYAFFDRYDADGNGHMDVAELESAMRWLGFALNRDEEFQQTAARRGSLDMNKGKCFTLAALGEDTLQLSVPFLIQGLDVSDGGVSRQDFLTVMRRRRECEIKHLSGLFHSDHWSTPGVVNMEGVVTMYQLLGYRTASAEVIKECAVECNIMYDLQDGFYFDDVYVLLQAFKRREGFLSSEYQLFKDVFKKYDRDDSGDVDVVELGGVWRSLGILITEEEQQQVFESVDIDRSGAIDFDELLKAMRWFKEDEERILQKAFERGDLDGNGLLSAKEIKCLLPAIGYPKLTPEQAEIVKRESGGRELDFQECVNLIKQLRDRTREDRRHNHGFSERELGGMHEKFNQYDKRRTGYIANESLRALLAEAFPEDTRSKSGQAKIAALFKTVDRNSDGKLEFNEYLELMRMVHDREMYEQSARELEKAKEAGYSLEEMRSYRKLFLICDSDASKEVEIDEFLRLFGTIVPITRPLKEKLKTILEEVDEDGTRSLDFPEFLMMMRRAEDALKETQNDNAEPATQDDNAPAAPEPAE